MAEDLSVPRPVGARPTEPAAAKPKPSRVYRRRFMLAYALLALAVVGAVAMFAMAMNTESESESAWSTWQPSGSGESRIWDIADHVAKNYRTSDGQLAARILAGPPTFNTTAQGQALRLPLEGVLVKGRASDDSDARATLFSGDAVMYALCGGGRGCEPTPALIHVGELGIKYQREALELALYTFKYVPEVNSVLAFLPPLPSLNAQNLPDQIRTAVYLERRQVEFQLDRPLRETLHTDSGLDFSDIEKNQLLRLVRPRLYTYEPEQAPNGAWILSLTRFQTG